MAIKVPNPVKIVHTAVKHPPLEKLPAPRAGPRPGPPMSFGQKKAPQPPKPRMKTKWPQQP